MLGEIKYAALIRFHCEEIQYIYMIRSNNAQKNMRAM